MAMSDGKTPRDVMLRRLRTKRATSILGMVVAFALLAALCSVFVFVLTADEGVAWIGLPGGSWRSVPLWYMQVGAAAILLPAIGLLAWRLTFGLYLFSIAGRPVSIDLSLEAGETIRWEGRQGVRALGRLHWTGVALTAAVAALCSLSLWRSWSTADSPGEGMFGTSMVLMLGGFSVIGVVVMYGGDVVRLALDRMAVTDRRIIWTDGKGRIGRELWGSELIGAGIVEGDERRGWVMVTARRGRRVRELDLHGVPRPQEAVAAIDALMRNHPAN